MGRFDVCPVFASDAEVDHWFTPRERIIDTFVVEVSTNCWPVIQKYVIFLLANRNKINASHNIFVNLNILLISDLFLAQIFHFLKKSVVGVF